MKSFLVLVLLFVPFIDKPAYLIFNQKAKPGSYEELVKKASKADIVLFGELHNNPISHWLQLELTKDLYAAKKQELVLGAEMFEADNQLVLSEYTQGRITTQQLESESKVWTNYKTDYKPLVDFAQDNKLSFIATNIPRRYASIVSKKGLTGLTDLSDDAKKNIAPLPITVDLNLPGYAEMMKMGGMHGSGNMGGMSAENMANAQAVKDATMAHFILQNWKKGHIFLHFNGSYHSQNFEGIYWYLKKANPDLNIVTIATVEEQNLNQPKEVKENLATFTLAVPNTMTKTH
ncbi:MAG: ChaN family lipoprotein [Siphonobacter sp.]